MLKVTDLRPGKLISIDKVPFEVLSYSHSKLGRGGAIIKVKLRNLKTNTIIDKTFKGDERVEEAQLNTIKSQFLYLSGESLHFMDSQTFNQFSVNKDKLGNKTNFLKEGSEVDVVFSGKEPLSVNLPIKVDFKITETEPGVKGDTASAATKEAVIETGFRFQAPLFIKIGDVVKIDTRTGKYLERVK